MKHTVLYRTLFLLSIMLIPQISYSYTVSGTIVDRLNNEVLAGATVKAYSSDSLLTVCSTNAKGYFITPNLGQDSVVLIIHCMGYVDENVRIGSNKLESLPIGYIALLQDKNMLKEVTVSAEGTIQKGDKYIIFPEKAIIDRSASAVDLLSKLQGSMPGLKVNTALQTYTIEEKQPVMMINGKRVSSDRIKSLNNNNILRIEYQNTPNIRYATEGASGVINFIVKPDLQGGSVFLNINAPITTATINTNFRASWNYKKSEWSIGNYFATANMYKSHYEISEQYISPNKTITQTGEGNDGKYNGWSNPLNLGYTFMYDLNTMLSIDANLTWYDYRTNANFDYQHSDGSNTVDYNRYSYSKNKYISPDFQALFKKIMNKNQSIEFLAYYNHSSGDYDKDFSETYDNSNNDYYLNSITDNNAWKAGIEGVYTREFKKIGIIGGLRYMHNEAENTYFDSSDNKQKDNLSKDNVYAYAQLVAILHKKLRLSTAVGVQYSHTTDLINQTQNDCELKSTITLNYQPNKKLSINYLFMYDPNVPSFAQQTNILRFNNSLSGTIGNMNVEPSIWTRNRIYIRYKQRKFVSTIWASYARTNKPLYQQYYYIDDVNSPYYDKFVGITANGTHTTQINLQCDLGLNELWNHCSIYVSFGWDNYNYPNLGPDDKFNHIYASLNGSVWWKKWSIDFNLNLSPRWTQNANTLKRSSRDNSISVQYNYNKWYFFAGVINPFTSRGFNNKSITTSWVHPIIEHSWRKEDSNRIYIGFTYRTNFGKSLKTQKGTLKKETLDRGY